MLPDGRLYGGSGDYSEVRAVLDWLSCGGAKPESLKQFSALLIAQDGQAYRLEERLVPLPMAAPHACGSGRDFAIAAMALGQTARQAVELAMQFDPWTGGEIMTLTLDNALVS